MVTTNVVGGFGPLEQQEFRSNPGGSQVDTQAFEGQLLEEPMSDSNQINLNHSNESDEGTLSGVVGEMMDEHGGVEGGPGTGVGTTPEGQDILGKVQDMVLSKTIMTGQQASMKSIAIANAAVAWSSAKDPDAKGEASSQLRKALAKPVV